MDIYPVRQPLITSDFGVERTLPDGRVNVHDGIDFITQTNDRTVFSLTQGFIAFDFDDYCHAKRYEKPNTGGNMVIITSIINNRTYHIRYLHLVKNNVVKGQLIPSGIPIGVYGDVGYSFGAHVHIDVYDGLWRHKINPYELFPLLKEIKKA